MRVLIDVTEEEAKRLRCELEVLRYGHRSDINKGAPSLHAMTVVDACTKVEGALEQVLNRHPDGSTFNYVAYESEDSKQKIIITDRGIEIRNNHEDGKRGAYRWSQWKNFFEWWALTQVMYDKMDKLYGFFNRHRDEL